MDIQEVWDIWEKHQYERKHLTSKQTNQAHRKLKQCKIWNETKINNKINKNIPLKIRYCMYETNM
jgi:hypothetical protein